jgi:hypothetical protein
MRKSYEKHGQTNKYGCGREPTYMSWTCMKQRCYNKKHVAYNRYGGKGIMVCERWFSFLNFLEDMGTRPLGKQLDRIDNNKDYCKDNCKWSTPKEQANNRSNNKLIEYCGIKKSLSQWANYFKINPFTLKSRLNLGYTFKEALTFEKGKWRRKYYNESSIRKNTSYLARNERTG